MFACTDNNDFIKNITQKIDISSSLEDNPGEKSIKKISDFLYKIKKRVIVFC